MRKDEPLAFSGSPFYNAVMRTPFFFLHIPRTAGTTLNSILKNNFEEHEILSIYREDDYKQKRILSAEERDQLKLIQGHLFLQSYTPPTIYSIPVNVFTFLRDPVQRLISEYVFLKTWPNNHLYRYLNENGVTFSDYITSDSKMLRYRGKNFMTRMISGEDFDLTKFPHEPLRIAKENITTRFGFVGIQERFNESLLLLKSFLGLDSIIYEKRNALRQELKEHITQSDIAIAESYNAADRELYIYASEKFSETIEKQGPHFALQLKRFNIIISKYNTACALIAQREGLNTQEDISLPKDSPLFRK
ncbi:sulfotransferase family 2 domain-containing protein [Desulfovibrio inopinatus]|uniref:sulfotransferase family 2 domain-containing protein n=1 Tax=Desulfovibrio inopinatus TaxID=102109 RepID=UPI00146FAFD1|nr:sulfotransferase family 2 domain-containing protein [Desulfovibrio inopinatus]